ncbi:MAG: hypothetical protein JJU36_05150 [Phycisphaeraceae bacterium]|nr:hypothetical protein [Phycisphaeraceae bacterium]
MPRTFGIATALLTVTAMLGGCLIPNPPATSRHHDQLDGGPVTTTIDPPGDVRLIRDTYTAVDNMVNSARTRLDMNKRILVATYVNLNDLRSTNQFGRMSGEMVGNRLAQMGYKTVSVNLRHEMAVIDNRGEFVLSRELNKIRAEHEADAVVVGTYVISGTGDNQTVLVSLRMIDVNDSSLLAGTNYELPVGPRLRTLLR